MNKINKQAGASLVFLAGLLSLSATAIIIHYAKLPDSVAGCLYGLSIGLLLLAIFMRSRRIGTGTDSPR